MLPHNSFNDLSTFLSCHLEYSHSAPPARSTRKRGLHSKRSFNQSFLHTVLISLFSLLPVHHKLQVCNI